MQANIFINHYDTLELASNASATAIERRFRHLARRYHPDNQKTGNRAKFDAIVEAHEALKDAAKRARYHAENEHHLPPFSPSEGDGAGAGAIEDSDEGGDGESLADSVSIERDLSIQNNILTMLYRRRRVNIREPGIGNAELERLSGCPPEHMEFHLWYLRAKGWIARGDDGLLAITIDGVDRAAAMYREGANKLLTDQS